MGGRRVEVEVYLIVEVPPEFATLKISHPELFFSVLRMMINPRRGRRNPS